MQPSLTFNIQTLGCKLNFSESSGLARQLTDAGYARVADSDPFDILVLNTCSVTDNADKKCRAIIRKAQKLNGSSFTVVIGCYAQLKPEEISSIEGVNLVLGASEKFKLIEHIENNLNSEKGIIKGGHIKDVKDFIPSYSFGDRTRTFLKVQDGCDYFCSFCTIPLARGRSRSPEIKQVIDQVHEITAKGVKEIVLTGVNIGDFGHKKEKKFIDLLKELDEQNGIERYRISSIEPNLLTDEIIDFVANSSKIMPHFHIPLQSGSDSMLKSMRRRYDTAWYESRVKRIKEKMPNACIGADVITGYPGETDDAFLKSVDFILGLGLSYLHVFTYSERANTIAIRKEDVVPVNVRRERSRKLQEISRKLKRTFYQAYAGTSFDVLFEKEENGFVFGFTPNYIRVKVANEGDLENAIHPVLLQTLNSDDQMIAEHLHTTTDILA